MVVMIKTDPDSRGGFVPYLKGVGLTYIDKEGDTSDLLWRIEGP